MAKLLDGKNTALFESMGVMSTKESVARAEIMFEHYSGVVEIEAKCMIDMITQHVLPSCAKAGISSSAVNSGLSAVKKGLDGAMALEGQAMAEAMRTLRLETMEATRKACDEAEGLVPPSMWTLSTYKELLFLDFNEPAHAGMQL